MARIDEFTKPVDRKQQLNVTVDSSIIKQLDNLVETVKVKTPTMTRSQMVNNILDRSLQDLKDSGYQLQT